MTWVTPDSSIIFVTATPAAPSPTTRTRRSSRFLPTILSALNSAAIVTTAVPCWSSWKTGMSISSLSRCSISKQRGAEMSSRLMPPKVGAMSRTALMICSGSCVSRQIGNASTSANSLKSIAFPSITGIAASGPMSPSPSTALPSETTATVLRLIVNSNALRAVGGDLLADARDARRVGHREVVAGLQRVLVLLVDLAAAVHLQGAVDVAEHPRAARGADRAEDLLPVLLVASVDGELANPLSLAAGAGHEVDALQRPAGLGDLPGELAQRLLPRIELDAHGDRELGGDGGDRRHGRVILCRRPSEDRRR